MIIYLTTWYEEKSPSRAIELSMCLWRTLESGEVDRVHLLAEAEPPFAHEKLSYRIVDRRPTYNDFFESANKLGKNGDILIVSNADIYPEKGTRDKIGYITENQCYALSRWDEDRKGNVKHFDRQDSQDIWVFKYPVKPVAADFCTGIPGCDNRIAFELKEAGYTVINPSKTLVFRHLHNSGVRNYSTTNTVPPPYLRVPSTELPVSRVISCPTEKQFRRVLHIGFPQPPLDRAFKKETNVSGGYYHKLNWLTYQNRYPELHREVERLNNEIRPDLIFLHTQTAGVITADLVRKCKKVHNATWVNWTGDVRKPLPKHYIDLGMAVDLTCFSNTNDVVTALSEGINAAYLQIGFDTEIFSQAGPGNEIAPPIVFMGNNYPGHFPLSDLREQMVDKLKARYGSMFGLYGQGWKGKETGNLMNNEAGEAAMYRGCKIAINLSHFNYGRYSSDRMFRIMGSGAFCLTHNYPLIEQDFIIGEHIAVWSDLDDLISKIDHFLQADEDRIIIAQNGAQRAHCCNTWETRLDELKYLLKIL